MHRSSLLAFALSFVVCAAIAACGADNLDAPPAQAKQSIEQCKGFELLMPNFVRAMSLGRTENLRKVMEEQLLKEPRPGEPPPMNDVLRSIFATLTRFAQKPPEVGAPADEYCAPTAAPPPLSQSNELCEMRRALDVLVHQGKGIEAIKVIEPQLVGVLKYVEGTGTDRTPHYEVAGVLGQMCSQDANCQLVNGLDLISAFSVYARSNDGKLMIQHLSELVDKPSINAFLEPNGLTEDGFVALGRTLITIVQGADASALDALPVPANVQADLGPVLADLKIILNPAYQPDLLTPMRRSLNCLNAKDRNMDVLRMLYRLAIRDALPEFGITRLTAVMKDIQKVDERGALIYLAGTLADAVKSDEQAIDSAAKVCKLALNTVPAPGEPRSNAELLVPSLSELVQMGIVNEAMCAMDTLLFGCAGGAQPACTLP